MSTRSLDGLKAYKARETVTKREAVIRIIEEMADDSAQVSVSEVARRAGVCRQFIYKHEDLWRRVKELELRQADAHLAAGADWTNIRDGRAADRSTLLRTVERYREQVSTLKTRVRQLEDLRARNLGEQLAALEAPSPTDAAEMAFSNERLRTNNDELRTELAEARKLIVRLQDDLAGARQALAEVVSETGDGAEILRLNRPTDTRGDPAD